MKKLIRQLIRFFVFMIPMYLLMLCAWGWFVPYDFLKTNIQYPQGSKGFLQTRIQEADTGSRVDILFLGSSHAYRGFDPRIFKAHGLKTFNLGSAAQSPLQTEWLAKQYLDVFEPRLVIYETYPATFQSDGVESSLDVMANTNNSSGLLPMVFTINHWKTYQTYIYDQFVELLGIYKKNSNPKSMGADSYVSGGFVETSINQNENPIDERLRISYSGKSWTFNPYQEQAFERTLNLLDQKKVPTLLVQLPVTNDAFDLYVNNAEIDSIFLSYGLNYHNLNNSVDLDDLHDFMDYHHLNQNGVTKVNHELIALLKKEFSYLFQDEY